MKTGIHPDYTKEAAITCACGATMHVGSSVPEIRTELCSNCHPFYTGKQKFVDTARRVEKFQEKSAKQKTVAASRKGKQAKHATRTAKKTARTEQA